VSVPGADAHNMSFPIKPLPYWLVQTELSWTVTSALSNTFEMLPPLN